MRSFMKSVIVMGTVLLMVVPFFNNDFFEYNTYVKNTAYDVSSVKETSKSASITSGPNASASNSTSGSSQKVTEKVDPRVPNYTGSVGDYSKKYFEWKSHDGKYTCYMDLYVDKNVYSYYRSLDRYYNHSEYIYYVHDKYSQEVVSAIVSNLKDIQAKAGYSDYQIVLEAKNFVQNCIAYQYDSDGRGVSEWPKYPLETVMDKKGDCEDTAMLLAAIIEKLGYDAVLLCYPDHAAVGVRCNNEMPGTYYNYNGKMYYYIETTNPGWDIGQIPAKYNGQSATVYEF